MLQVINSDNQKKREHRGVKSVSAGEDKSIHVKNILKLQKKSGKDYSGHKFYQWILNGDFSFTILASSRQYKKTDERYKFIPTELILARQAHAPPAKRFLGIEPENDDIQERADNQAE
jgi:hypothetical protein